MGLKEIKKTISIMPGDFFAYNSETKAITYVSEALKTPEGQLAQLHKKIGLKIPFGRLYFYIKNGLKCLYLRKFYIRFVMLTNFLHSKS